MQVAKIIPHWSHLGSPLPLTRPKLNLQSYKGTTPWDGHAIYFWRHIKTNQVIYSLTSTLDEAEALKQLTFYGKKTVPSEIRKDVWRPYATVAIPVPQIDSIERRNLKLNLSSSSSLICDNESLLELAEIPELDHASKQLVKASKTLSKSIEKLRTDQNASETLGIDKLADFVYRKLIHLRMLRDYAWKEDGGSVAVTEARRNRTDVAPMFEQRLAKRRSHKRREAKKDLKERQDHLMDQRGTSVADIATAIDHLNEYIFERVNLAHTTPQQRGLNFRVHTPWRKNRRFVYSYYIKHRFRQLQQWSDQAKPAILASLKDRIDSLASKLDKKSSIQDREVVNKLRIRHNNILRARRAVAFLRGHVPDTHFADIPMPEEARKLKLSIPWQHLIRDIKALYSSKFKQINPIEVENLEYSSPVHIYWADLFDRKYTNTWANNVLHHWMGPKTGADLVRAAIPNFGPRTSLDIEWEEESSEELVAAARGEIQVEIIKPKAELQRMEYEKTQVVTSLERLLPWLVYLKDAKTNLEAELEAYKVSDISELHEANVAKFESATQELAVQQRASIMTKHDPLRRKDINFKIFVATRARDALSRSVSRAINWNSGEIPTDTLLPTIKTAISEELRRLSVWSQSAIEEKNSLTSSLDRINDRIHYFQNGEHEPIVRNVYRGNEGIDEGVLIDGRLPDEIEDESNSGFGDGIVSRKGLPAAKEEDNDPEPEEKKPSRWFGSRAKRTAAGVGAMAVAGALALD